MAAGSEMIAVARTVVIPSGPVMIVARTVMISALIVPRPVVGALARIARTLSRPVAVVARASLPVVARTG